MNIAEQQIEGFSKHLLVTVFAVFAFSSASFADIINLWVKVFYMLGLCAALMSLNYGYKLNVCLVNSVLENAEDTRLKPTKGAHLPPFVIESMARCLQKQYYYSIASLAFLLIAIFVQFFWT
ncbi:MAG: hypothetical protein JJU31_09090 [Wenzhouxiangella sp.]|nr:hypothetical protein [Wenzhouxiangella sp.]